VNSRIGEKPHDRIGAPEQVRWCGDAISIAQLRQNAFGNPTCFNTSFEVVPTFRARDDDDALFVRVDPFLVAAFASGGFGPAGPPQDVRVTSS